MVSQRLWPLPNLPASAARDRPLVSAAIGHGRDYRLANPARSQPVEKRREPPRFQGFERMLPAGCVAAHEFALRVPKVDKRVVAGGKPAVDGKRSGNDAREPCQTQGKGIVALHRIEGA